MARRDDQWTMRMPTKESLERAAIDYLRRFAAAEADLRRVLQARLRKAGAFRKDEDLTVLEGLQSAIEAIIEKHRNAGILNDSAFADMKTASLRRGGRSARAIAAKLQQKGIKPEMIKASLLQSDDGLPAEEGELKAARQFAKRKRLGPFSVKEPGIEKTRKELATFARAGFSLKIAREVLETSEAWEADDSFD